MFFCLCFAIKRVFPGRCASGCAVGWFGIRGRREQATATTKYRGPSPFDCAQGQDDDGGGGAWGQDDDRETDNDNGNGVTANAKAKYRDPFDYVAHKVP
jgi:hypothetical protein